MRAAAARRLARERLNGDLDRLLGELELEAAERHPVEVLLDAVHRCSAMVQVLGALVGGLEARQPSGGEGAAGGLWGPNHLGDGAPHVLTDMYATWLDRAARAAKLALDAGVEERRVRLAEDQGRLVAEVIRRIVAALGLDPAAPEVREVIRRELTAAPPAV